MGAVDRESPELAPRTHFVEVLLGLVRQHEVFSGGDGHGRALGDTVMNTRGRELCGVLAVAR